MISMKNLKTALLAAASLAAVVSVAPTDASARGFGGFQGGGYHGGFGGYHGGFGGYHGGWHDGGYHWNPYRWGGYRWGYYPWGGYRLGYGLGYGTPVYYQPCPLGTIRSAYGGCIPRFRPL